MAFDKELYRKNRAAGLPGNTPALPRENAYMCDTCKKPTVTVDVDEGVTPAFLGCRATEGCKGMGHSMMYPRLPRPAEYPAPAFEWYKPTEAEVAEVEKDYPGSMQHWKNGGLFLRPRTDATPIYHDPTYVK